VSQPALTARDEANFSIELADMWRDAAQAGLRYWGRLGRLAFESITVLVPLVGVQQPAEVSSAAPPASAALAARTILVEAETGQAGMGVFLVENVAAQRVSTRVGISPFLDPEGRGVRPAVTFRPDVIELDPGDQLIVQVAARFDDTLEPDVRYRAEISLPGLSETRIPIVLRRRPSAAPRRRARAKTKTRAS
jgi:hypothetical protein